MLLIDEVDRIEIETEALLSGGARLVPGDDS